MNSLSVSVNCFGRSWAVPSGQNPKGDTDEQ